MRVATLNASMVNWKYWIDPFSFNKNQQSRNVAYLRKGIKNIASRITPSDALQIGSSAYYGNYPRAVYHFAKSQSRGWNYKRRNYRRYNFNYGRRVRASQYHYRKQRHTYPYSTGYRRRAYSRYYSRFTRPYRYRRYTTRRKRIPYRYW